MKYYTHPTTKTTTLRIPAAALAGIRREVTEEPEGRVRSVVYPHIHVSFGFTLAPLVKGEKGG